MSNRRVNESAFPLVIQAFGVVDPGLSKREWFAGQALQACILCDPDCPDEGIAKQAFKYADAMLKEAGEHE